MTTQKNEINFGDHVWWDLSGRETGYVIGFADYAPDKSIAVVGDQKAWGMPINVRHLNVISTGHQAECLPWRERYISRFPNTLLAKSGSQSGR